MTSALFESVLVANRGEIAVRVIRTLRRLGIRSIAVHTPADVGARHVREADEAVLLDGPAGYLEVPAVVAAAVATRAAAVHPGYGFLAENAEFARACAAAGVVFVGPPVEAIRAMGDKIAAKASVEAAGVPVVPGVHRPGLSDDDLVEAAAAIGFPVLLKPSAGGGGKGMHRVDDPSGLLEAIGTARREARSSFGDDALLIERYVATPRHIEIQVLADRHGSVIHLGERECSLQRRHQKVVEEAPSPLLTPQTRERMGAAAVAVSRSCGYVGAGTVEFIVSADRPEEFFFLEMNTRLQVEHPVTELVTGLDLVAEQLQCAAGEPLRIGQPDVRLNGHAVEARVYAEDPARDFLPSTGRVLRLSEPFGEQVRVDSGISTGSEIGTGYDPMLAKVIAWAPDRTTALSRLHAALGRCTVLGVGTNLAFLRALLADPAVVAGELDTGLIERRLPSLVEPAVPEQALAAAGFARLAELRAGAGPDPFDVLTGWRLGAPAEVVQRLLPLGTSGEPPVEVVLGEGRVRVGAGEPVPASARLEAGTLALTYRGVRQDWSYVRDGDVLWVGLDGAAWGLRVVPRPALRGPAVAGGGGPLVAPMPGTVSAVQVKVGDPVVPGQALVVVEAMKMEHAVRASVPGTVSQVLVEVGQTVALEAPLVVLEPAPRENEDG